MLMMTMMIAMMNVMRLKTNYDLRIFVLALMQLRICAALLTAILFIVLRPLLLFAV